MNRNIKRFILDVLGNRSTMTLATVRPDGYPQATTVAFANEGLVLYFMCDVGAQKVHNIAKNKKVSLAIDGESADWDHIHGLSMGGTAKIVESLAEKRRAMKLLGDNPSMAELSDADVEASAVVRVTPKVISAINYDLGFGHTDLVRVSSP